MFCEQRYAGRETYYSCQTSVFQMATQLDLIIIYLNRYKFGISLVDYGK